MVDERLKVSASAAKSRMSASSSPSVSAGQSEPEQLSQYCASIVKSSMFTMQLPSRSAARPALKPGGRDKMTTKTAVKASKRIFWYFFFMSGYIS